MKALRHIALVMGQLALLRCAACGGGGPPASATPTAAAPDLVPRGDPRAEVEIFNQKMRDGTMRMDTAALVALWEEDGISLLPGEKPLVGKKAVAAFIEEAMKSLPGAKMQSFEMDCTGLEVAGSGDWASEACEEHQVVDLGAGKPPFDGRGKLLFVLHRGKDGAWRIRREMWNQGAKR